MRVNRIWRKSAFRKLIDEIDTTQKLANCESTTFWRLCAFRHSLFAKVWWNWLLESISPTYYVQLLRRYFCAKKVQTLNLSAEKLHAKLSYEISARKMLVKLTTGRWINTSLMVSVRKAPQNYWTIQNLMIVFLCLRFAWFLGPCYTSNFDNRYLEITIKIKRKHSNSSGPAIFVCYNRGSL